MSSSTTTRPSRYESTAQRWFQDAQLGDQRRVNRLIYVAECLLRQPGQSLPNALSSPCDLKALYRLMDCETTTHESILAPARRATLESMRRVCDDTDQRVLVLHDDTELDYSTHKSLRGELGHVGNNGYGYICHNSLAVTDDGEVLGLVDQILHRRPLRKGATRTAIKKCPRRETRLWLRGAQHLPANDRIVDVCDAAADTAEFLEHEFDSGRRFVIRSGYRRNIFPGHEGPAAKIPLKKHLRGIRACGGMVQDIQVQGGRRPRKARRAKLLVSYSRVRCARPGARPENERDTALPLYVVRVWEPHPPKGAEPIEWILWTNEPIHGLEDAIRVIRWYVLRWIVEEYHKAMKTGSRVEECQFTSTARLEPMIALLSVTATKLLTLRDVARRPDATRRRAQSIFPREYVVVLSQWRWSESRPELNAYDFCLALARLGGHQNRRGDGHPGWLVLWRGWQKLHAMVCGARLAKKCG